MRSLEAYDHVFRSLSPKFEQLQEFQEQLETIDSKLSETEAASIQARTHSDLCKKQLQQTVERKEDLQSHSNECETRLASAKKLLLLSG